MKKLSLEEIQALPKLARMHLVNSLGGLKSANLIGTMDTLGNENLAIFNSVIHLGSNPPMLNFMMRPHTVERHTYENIKDTLFFTVNHVHEDWVNLAHQTSAKYEREESEFEKVGLTAEYKDNFSVPLVKESQVKMVCSFVNEYHIKEHNCHLIIGQIEALYFHEDLQHEDGFLDLTKAKTAGIIGLDGYVKTSSLKRYDYARPHQKPSLK